MPAKDIYHDAVKNALIKDDWVITQDPLRLSWGSQDMYIDLGAERFLGAEKAGEYIAVEIKSFVGASRITDLERAIGQYVLYKAILAEQEPNRMLYLAVPHNILQEIFENSLGQLLLKKELARVIGFDQHAEVITKWIR